ncbi:Protein CBR-SRW-108 [Caenorhabditis briggsae]|uniref:Protein CBR-SRW-108 n=1 Tax=Caenorhabditis briggsae TaxID=6238 RepID=A8XB89_CAEBR|nr:Protein CBR-SRW-108 [Caenorhabditis briggsae]CAP29869.2 Protein CBR-SRW-108 [Caenorhabditis briggsae]
MVESAYKGELAEIIEVIESIADPLNTANLFLSFVSIFINILHFIILTSSSMKSSSTNVIMIGIAIVDIFTLTLTVCVTSNLFWKVYFDMAVWGLQDYFRRCSTWLGLMMAIVRTMIVKNILGNQ